MVISWILSIMIIVMFLDLMRTFWWNGPIDSVFRFHGSWYDIGNTSNNFTLMWIQRNPGQGLLLEAFGIHVIIFFPFLKRTSTIEKSYGFSFFDDETGYPNVLWLQWGSMNNYKVVFLPWDYQFIRHEYLFLCNGWPENEIPEWKYCNCKYISDDELKTYVYRAYGIKEDINRFDVIPLNVWYNKLDWTYVTKSGKTQKVKVKSYIRKRIRQRLIYKWLRIPKYEKTYYLETEFSAPIGDDNSIKSYTHKIPMSKKIDMTPINDVAIKCEITEMFTNWCSNSRKF